MSKFSTTATAFDPVTQILRKFNLLVEQIQIKLKLVDIYFSSALQKQATDMHHSSVPIQHSPLSSINIQNFKRYFYDSKLGEIINANLSIFTKI